MDPWGRRRGKKRTWVIGPESQNNVTSRPHDKGIAAHGDLRQPAFLDAEVLKGTRIFLRTVHSLEGVTVEMEGVTTGIEVVEYNLHNLALLKYRRVRICTVNSRVGGVLAGVQGRVQSRDLGSAVGDVVEECVVHAVVEVIHHDVELDDAVGLGEELHPIVRDERHIVKGVEFLDETGVGEGLAVVVNEPTGSVVVQVVWKDIKEGLSFVRLDQCLVCNVLTVSMLVTIGKFFDVSFLVVRRKLTRWAAER